MVRNDKTPNLGICCDDTVDTGYIFGLKSSFS
jgi:hypothetical protein